MSIPPHSDLPSPPVGNAVIGQSGGPTAVINQSLVGVIEGLRDGLHKAGIVKRIVGMRHGVRGLTKEGGAGGGDGIVDLTGLPQDRLDHLAATPSAALGSTRDKPDAAYCQRILESCQKHDIRYFFYIGGNDSSDTCRIVSEMAGATNYDLRCFHVPKTIDNDLVANDHCPGFPSAARFVAMAFMADALDNFSLPGIKINVVMGRHAGFLTAAAALARRSDHSADAPAESLDGPQLIYLPEIPFDMERFAGEVEAVYSKKGRCHIAVSEGITDKDGKEIGATLIQSGQRDAHGNVQLSGSGALGDALADFLKRKLTPTGGKAPRVRADTFGYVQRCWPDPSPVDAGEARQVGRHAAKLAMSGEHAASVTIERPSLVAGGGSAGEAYRTQFNHVPLATVAGKTRKLPAEFIGGTNNMSQAFLDYCRPLVGELPRFERL